MIDVHKRQGQSQQCFEHRRVFNGVSKSTWFCIGYAQTAGCTGHLIGCGKKLKIMQKFSAILCGRKWRLCGKDARLCGNF